MVQMSSNQRGGEEEPCHGSWKNRNMYRWTDLNHSSIGFVLNIFELSLHNLPLIFREARPWGARGNTFRNSKHPKPMKTLALCAVHTVQPEYQHLVVRSTQ